MKVPLSSGRSNSVRSLRIMQIEADPDKVAQVCRVDFRIDRERFFIEIRRPDIVSLLLIGEPEVPQGESGMGIDRRSL